MFGYLLPYRPKLTEEQFNLYRSHYCGLCHQMGHSFGTVSRLTLSYDFAFLSLVYSSLYGDEQYIENKRCLFNPFRKHPSVNMNFYTEFCSGVAVIMAYYKCKDNINDSTFFKGLTYRFVSLSLRRAFRKAQRKFPDIYASVKSMYEHQLAAEESVLCSLDQAADPTAQMLASLASFFSKDSEQIPHLRRFGYMLGRFIYLCDAIDDYDSDKKSESFNPLIRSKYTDMSLMDILDTSDEILNVTLTEIIQSFRKLHICKNKEILENFIYFGLDNTRKSILKKRGKIYE